MVSSDERPLITTHYGRLHLHVIILCFHGTGIWPNHILNFKLKLRESPYGTEQFYLNRIQNDDSHQEILI